jgi:hypothetical protein
MIVYILLGVFIILQIADVWTTLAALKTGKAHEANPIMEWFMDKLGVLPALLITKAVIIGVVVYFVNVWIMLAILNCLYVFAVYLNIKTLQKLKVF